MTTRFPERCLPRLPVKTVQYTLEIARPVPEVFSAWCDFEGYPRFMETVQEVRSEDGERLKWRADIHGQQVEWESLITVRIPNQRLAWRVLGGDSSSGAITTEAVGAHTQLTLQFGYTPEAPWGGMEETEVRDLTVRALERFKEMFESGGSHSAS